MGLKVTNNAFGTLNASINSSATTIVLVAGQGARFPTLSAGDYFYATLIDTSNNLEIVKCTARSTDTLTVVRGQDSTTARAYATNDRFELRPTAILFNEKANANEYLPLTGGALTNKLGVGTSTLTNMVNVAGAIQSSAVLTAVEPTTIAMSQESGFGRVAAFGANSSTPGVLDLMVISSNGGVQKGSRIDSLGRMTISHQPRFAADRSGDQTGYNAENQGSVVVIYNQVQQNMGSHYNASTGLFTAPVAGMYIFQTAAYTNFTVGQAWLVINGARAAYGDFTVGASGGNYGGMTWIYYLAANDTVGFHVYAGGVTSATIYANAQHTWFRGYLLG
jgi:hypothetical protein